MNEPSPENRADPAESDDYQETAAVFWHHLRKRAIYDAATLARLIRGAERDWATFQSVFEDAHGRKPPPDHTEAWLSGYIVGYEAGESALKAALTGGPLDA